MTVEVRGDVIVVGSLNLDRTYQTARLPGAGETVHGSSPSLAPGGKGSNQAVAAALLGATVRLVGAVGADDAGALVTAAAQAAGVRVDAVRRHPSAPTGEAVIVVDDSGENAILVVAGANAEVGADDIAGLGCVPGDVVVLGFESPDAAVVAAASEARRAGARVVLNPSPLRDIPAGLLADVDLLVVNEHELAGLTNATGSGDVDLLTAARMLGCDLVVTLGAAGAALAIRGRVERVPSPTVTAVDTSGCGDAFLGALVGALAAGATPGASARAAAIVGAIVATRPGTQSAFPTRAEVDGWAVGA